MAQRCIIAAYKLPKVINDEIPGPHEGWFQLTIDALYIDTLVQKSGRYMSPIADLDPSAPANWDTVIKAACVAIGNQNGFPALIDTGVFIPQYH